MTESTPASPKTARHGYQVDVVWTGNTGQGTSSYRSYERTHEVRADGKSAIDASADPVFLGDADRYNPEELLVASLSQCHMLWFLHLAADSGVVVTGYHDQARGILTENPDGTGQFESVELAPAVTVADRASVDVAEALHERAHELCYIAKAVNFPVHCSPTTRIAN
ncbi:OsmC family protein [Saccharopolyspora hordei]|uniref:Organic hydroperoxide reductase OsmC/OhrA n=1 Tax=Saccharopolyspora hordei TaxID=1838 RepID=A0A853ATC2_9PSEU|nr:OsmC family protein [Saccharopolyspora hordei]NYI85905.1 organic hydroperoxide reductase OsmC/OhrA [Saccharopolyspora hordei]